MGELVTVVTKYGPVVGIKKVARLGDKYTSFQKIPYVRPTVGKLRFKDPIPADPWSEPLDCTEEGPGCTQFNNILAKIVGEQDCLHINVFTKNVQPEKPFPVMVYIHGGAFMRGSSSVDVYGPDFLLQKDVLLVTFNYRIGAFGFLSLADPSVEVPGNAGLKDQSMALRWVKENIASFGGDSNNITVFGESAGGCSVHYQMISNMSKNLFHKAIVQSGTALNNWSVVPARDWAYRLAQALGFQGNATEGRKIVEFLQEQDHFQIAEAQEKLVSPEERRDRILFPFGPVIEPYVGKQCLITGNPKDMCRRAWSRSLPILIGGTSDEGLFCYREAKTNPTLLPNVNNEFPHLVPLELGLSPEEDKCKRFGQGLKELYFGDKDVSEETIDGYVMLMTDKLFWHGVHRTILSRVHCLEKGATYVYRFNFDSPHFNHYRVLMCGDSVRGVCHADELSYLFSNIFAAHVPCGTTPEFRTIQVMVELWTSFAITGNPNKKTSPYLEGVAWDPLPDKRTNYKLLNISDTLSVVEIPERKRMEYWDSMYESDQLF